MKIEKGRVVKAAAGRDKGSYFVITEMEENYVFIADGKRRKLSLPRYAAAHTVTDMGRY